ncbi:hypothetical protein cypCar_00026430 [Cyprinus carpio]|nr:hypothetical protein cypCar_00026430 [Cyprinus carpio]
MPVPCRPSSAVRAGETPSLWQHTSHYHPNSWHCSPETWQRNFWRPEGMQKPRCVWSSMLRIVRRPSLL